MALFVDSIFSMVKSSLHLTIIFTLLNPLFSSCAFNFASAGTPQLSQTPSFNWSSIEPSPDLIWHDCNPTRRSSAVPHQQVLSSSSSTRIRKTHCARLSLPLDYHNASNPYNVTVPLLKVSTAPSPSHRGTIITSPGGAGSSRIKILHGMNKGGFLELLDPEYEFDILTFEQRGVGYSEPSARCFESVLEGKLWEERLNDVGGVISTDEGQGGLGVRLAGAKGRGELCARASDEDRDIRKHMSTAYAARDMLEILKKLEDRPTEPDESPDAPQQRHLAELQFLGLSYGTVLGLTFASLYPNHVSRMLLDGTGDCNDWVGKWQMGHNADTDAVWSTFFTDCFAARDDCPLWRAEDSGAEDVETRVDVLLDGLKKMPAYSVSNGTARLITYRDVRMAIFWATNAPEFTYPTIAGVMDELVRGYTNITLSFPFGDRPTCLACSAEKDEDILADANAGAGAALNCGDAEDISEASLEDFQSYLSALERQSTIAAFAQGERKLRCLGWPRALRPKWRFTGPFSSTSSRNGNKNSTLPILFLNNRLDTMTPISNAHKMAKGFPGSVVLEQNARGHTALGNTLPSLCTVEHVRRFLREGILPKLGTVCDAECNMFDGSCTILRSD